MQLTVTGYTDSKAGLQVTISTDIAGPQLVTLTNRVAVSTRINK